MTRCLFGQYAQQIVVPGKPLGRIRFLNEVEARGTSVLAAPTDAEVAALRSVFWPSNRAEAFNQLRGSCTGNAAAGCASNAPFGWNLSQDDAEALYSRATQLDPFPGQYPPDDTGSTGWAAMTAAVEAGYFAGFSLATDLYSVLHALQTRPGVTGEDWYEGDDEPESETGLVKPTGRIRGGHEYTLVGCELFRRPDDGTIILDESYLVHRQSWGPWGVAVDGAEGYFRTRLPHFAAVLASGGDCHFPDLP